MTYDIPNAGAATFPDQEEVDAVDWLMITAAAGGRRGVSSGCAVTQRGAGANNSVDVAAGTVVYDGVESAVTGGNVVMTAANATNPRFDFVTVNNVGTKAYNAGTASANPVFPAIPANSVVLAAIYVPANDNVINTAQIMDRRITVAAPVGASGWTTVSKTADQTKTSDVTLATDTALSFPMAANTKYRVRGVIWFDTTAVADFKYAFTGPASPTLAWFQRSDGTGVNAPAARAPDVAYPGSTTLASTAAGTNSIAFEAIVHNGANTSPAFGFQWAQGTSDASNTIVHAGSYLEYSVA